MSAAVKKFLVDSSLGKTDKTEVLLFMLTSVLTFMTFLIILSLCRLIIRYFRPPPPNVEQEPALQCGLSAAEIRTLPSFDCYTKSPDSECTICLSSIEKGDKCRLLPGCKHVFHAACVDAWLMKVPTCPLCRASVAGMTKAADLEMIRIDIPSSSA